MIPLEDINWPAVFAGGVLAVFAGLCALAVWPDKWRRGDEG